MAFDYASKISALLANAEDESLTPEARESYRAKAEKLMHDYRIAEEDLIARDETAAVPVLDVVTVLPSHAVYNPLKDKYRSLFSVIADHAGIRVAFEEKYGKYENRGEDSTLTAKVVGYEGDIAYAKFLWTAAHLAFLTRIDARVDPKLSDQLNCYYMRGSGMKRNEIANKLWGSAYNDGHAHGKVQKLYVAECKLRGETPKVSGRGIQVDLYRDAYASSFVSEFSWRLTKASDAAGVKGGGIELHGRKSRVDEAFYAEYPDHRPMDPEKRRKLMEERRAQRAAIIAACSPCQNGKKDKGSDYLCRNHRAYEWTKSDQRRWERRNYGAEAQAGNRAGEAAARSVNLQRGFDRQEAAPAPESRSAIGG
jgi:hypothetical protein